MGLFSKFETKMEDAIDDLGDKLFDSPISPVQIAKKAEKQMRRNKMVGAGKQYAPTLYTVLVNENDDSRLFGYYPTLAGETETYLKAKANESGFSMDGDPLVRFIVDKDLKTGKFDVIAEAVAADIISQLREEEMERYGVNNKQVINSVQANQQVPQRSSVGSNNSYQQVPVQNKPATPNVSSPFAPYEPVNIPENVANAPVQQVPQQAPAPRPMQAPLSAPAPSPKPAVNNNQSYNPSMVSGSKTAAFSGNFGTSNGPMVMQNNVAIPSAKLTNQNTGMEYVLSSATTVIGRENTCNVVLSDVNTSRQHAQITYSQGLWICNDLGSTNGTFVNNQEITSREIHPGDIITIGLTNLVFNVD